MTRWAIIEKLAYWKGGRADDNIVYRRVTSNYVE
jgi:hypothetical protein